MAKYPDFIGAEIDGLEEVQHIISGWPQAAKDAAVDDASEYLIEVFKQQPPPKYVTRKAAYGTSFFSDKQRRWFFAALNSGEIKVPYRRTQEMRNAWRQVGSGERSFIVNETQAAVFTMGDDTQSRHEKLVGWETVSQKISKSMDKLVKRLVAAGEKALRKLGAE